MVTAVHHLANHGDVALIQRADSGHAILLASDLLVNLAASVALEARRHERGPGKVDKAWLLVGDYPLAETQAEVWVTPNRWHGRPGRDLVRFIEGIDAVDFIPPVGTPA